MQNILIYALLIYIVFQAFFRYRILKIYRLFRKKEVELNPREMLMNEAYRKSLKDHFKEYHKEINQYVWSFASSIFLTIAMVIFVIFALIVR